MRTSDVIIDPKDKKYFVQNPDASFNPQRNYAVMKEVHEDTQKYFAGLRRKQHEGWEDRMDVLSSYADYKFNRGKGGSYEQYVGRDLRNRLIGERILEKIRVLSTVDKLKGNTKIQL